MNKYTINDFNRDFPDDSSCLEWLKKYLYPRGIKCQKCDKITKHHRVTKRACYACDKCGSHTYPMTGTIFEHSATPLKLWFYAIYLMSSTRCGISAKQIQRETGVTYKTAWRMFQQIRSMLIDTYKADSGEFEIDDAYMGGHRRGIRGRGALGKTPMVGIAQRSGKVRAWKTKELKQATVYPVIQSSILPQSKVYTDEYHLYGSLHKLGFEHTKVYHGQDMWVNGEAHTNTIEGFWSLLKRGISGVYHAVSEKYLQNYINEYAFRYNHRKDGKSMFLTVLERV